MARQHRPLNQSRTNDPVVRVAVSSNSLDVVRSNLGHSPNAILVVRGLRTCITLCINSFRLRYLTFRSASLVDKID